jgi:hypothetical protein
MQFVGMLLFCLFCKALTNMVYDRLLAHSRCKRTLDQTIKVMQLLETVDVYVSKQISKTLFVSQKGKEVQVQANTAYAHIQEDEDKLSFFIPIRKKEQEVCFTSHLPEMLLMHFDAQSFANIGDLGLILTTTRLSSIDEILNHAGIINLDGIERPLDNDSLEESSDSMTSVTSSTESLLLGQVTTPSQLSEVNVSRSTRFSQRAVSAPLLNSFSPTGHIMTPNTFNDEDMDTSHLESVVSEYNPNLYKRLLEVCVNTGKSLHSFPKRGSTLSVTEVNSSLSQMETRLAVNGPDIKSLIGAAGELFVGFKFLFDSKANLIRFSNG